MNQFETLCYDVFENKDRENIVIRNVLAGLIESGWFRDRPECVADQLIMSLDHARRIWEECEESSQ